MRFEGTYVAMVTPFTKDEEIDEEGFRHNINYLIDGRFDINKRDVSLFMRGSSNQHIIDMRTRQNVDNIKNL